MKPSVNSLRNTLSVGRITLALGVAAILLPAAAQAKDPKWFDALRQQIADREKCMAEEIIQPMDAIDQIAMVKCEDGRYIEATRSGDKGDFKFRVNQ